MKATNWIVILSFLLGACDVSADGIPMDAGINDAAQADTVITTVPVYASLGYPYQGAPVGTPWSGPSGTLSLFGGSWEVPLPITVGHSLTKIVVNVTDTGPNGGGTASFITADLVSTTRGLLATVTSFGWGIPQQFTLTPSCSPCTLHVGENFVVRYSPKDSAGNWTGGAIDPAQLVIQDSGLAPTSPPSEQLTISPVLFTSLHESWQYNSSPHAMFTTQATGAFLVGNIPVHRGDTIQSLQMPVSGLGSVTLTAKLMDMTMNTTLLGTTSVTVISKTDWSQLFLDIPDTVTGDNTGLDITITGLPTDTWGVEVGMISMNYIPAH